MKTIYEVRVDARRAADTRVTVEKYKVVRETPKTWFGLLGSGKHEYRFLKEKENVIRRDYVEPNTGFGFFTTDKEAITKVAAEGVREGLYRARLELERLESDIARLEETARGVEGE